MAKRQTSTSEVYDLINDVRKELKQDIATMGISLSSNQGHLEKKFDELEAGRLTRAEASIADLRIQVATAKVKFAILGFIAASTVGALISTVIPRFL